MIWLWSLRLDHDSETNVIPFLVKGEIGTKLFGCDSGSHIFVIVTILIAIYFFKLHMSRKGGSSSTISLVIKLVTLHAEMITYYAACPSTHQAI